MTRSHAWVPQAAGLACLLIGLMDIASAVTKGLAVRLHELGRLLPGVLTNAAAAATVATGVLLVLLAHALRRRKRRAWRAVVLLLALSVVLHVVKGLDVEEAVVSLTLLLVLVLVRDEFYAAGDPRTRWRAVGVLAALLVTDVVVGQVLLLVREGSILGRPSAAERLQQVLTGLVGLDGPLRFRHESSADLVAFVLLALGLLTLLVTAYLVLRPEAPVARLDAADEARLRELVAAHGGQDSLAYFALRRDKSVIFSPGGEAAIAYRVVSGVMLASGDPLGDPQAWPGAIERFVAEADRHAWVPAVVGCSRAGGQVWRRETGLTVLELGDEAVIDVATFTLEGRPMRNVRQMLARVQRAGYTCQVRRVRDIAPAERALVREQAATWRGEATERGFSMALGRIGDPHDGDCVLVTAHGQGRVRAFLHFVPWGADGLSLDLMRRDRQAEPGLNELLIVGALQAAAGLGVARVSLNFAAFRAALERGDRLGAGPVMRLWRRVLGLLSRWWQIESLYRFNAKFQPWWQPRFLAYPGGATLPRIVFAILQAEAFVRVPRLFDHAPAEEPALTSG
ncbi:MAG TPA: phosphatidylglycerol lysyltransferase domain-containing protein [Actinomycetes bacterium]|nr:phosphatidylglycerol lysyltransferase domain-containing protein [Actinomycetes bacterium]